MALLRAGAGTSASIIGAWYSGGRWTLSSPLRIGAGKLDSTALGVFVGVRRTLAVEERLAIVCPLADVLKIFELAGVDGVFALFSSLAGALANVHGHAANCG